MAKHGKRRKFRRYIKGQIDQVQALTTLAAQTGVKQSVADTVDDTTWCSSVELTWELSGTTAVTGAGPIAVGISHGDYTLAEIEEWIENASSWKAADLRQQEVGRRKIRRVGVFSEDGADSTTSYVLNDGKPIRTKCGWYLSEDQTIALWYYNQGSLAYATTVPQVHAVGHANLWPK